MQALLRFGQFTTVMNISGEHPPIELSVIEPRSLLSMSTKAELMTIPDEVKPYRLNFRLYGRLNQEMFLYEYTGRS